MSQISASLRFRWLTALSMVDEIMKAQLLTCWRDVSNAEGAVGFPFLPVTTEQVRPAIDALIGSLGPSLSRILVAPVDHTLAGWLVLVGNADTLTAHWARVLRVQTALEYRGAGVGRALMREVEWAARDDLRLTICTWSFAGVWAWSVSMSVVDGARSVVGPRLYVLTGTNGATRCSGT